MHQQASVLQNGLAPQHHLVYSLHDRVHVDVGDYGYLTVFKFFFEFERLRLRTLNHDDFEILFLVLLVEKEVFDRRTVLEHHDNFVCGKVLGCVFVDLVAVALQVTYDLIHCFHKAPLQDLEVSFRTPF